MVEPEYLAGTERALRPTLPTEAAPVQESRSLSRARLFGTIGPLFVLLLLWLYMFNAEGAFSGGPNGKSFGGDSAMFLGAAKVLQHGGNPYAPSELYSTEKAYLAAQGLHKLPPRAVVRVGNPPILFWLLQPFTALPFGLVSLCWSVFLYLLSAVSLFLLLSYFGWRHRVVPAMVFLLMPQVVFGPFYGNVVTLVFAGASAALYCARTRPFLAGTFLTVAWLKPPIALPIVVLVLLMHAPHPRKMFIGFVSGTGGMLLAMLGTTGPARLVQWEHAMFGYSHAISASPDIATFAGLYVRSVPDGFRLGLSCLSLAIGVIFTALVWHRQRNHGDAPWLRVAWLWALWFFVAPYAHFYDEVVLTIPVIALIGRDGRWLNRREPVIALYMSFAALLVVSAAPWNIQLLWLPLLAVVLCLFLARRSPRFASSPHLVPARG